MANGGEVRGHLVDRWGMMKSGKVNEKAGVRKRLDPRHVPGESVRV